MKAIAQNLRLPIRQAHTHLNTALNFWELEKARQCEETERLIFSISSLKINVSERKMKVEQMNQQLQGLNQQIKDSEQNVEQAKKALSNAQDTLNNAEREKKKSEKNNLCQQLKSEEKEKQITEQRLRDQERQLQDLQMAQQRSIELSDKLMRTCHVMTKIWGKSQELNNEARRAYSLEPLLTPIKEIVDMFTPEEQKEIKQNTFLLSKEIDFSSITWKLKAVCDANADSSIRSITLVTSSIFIFLSESV